MNDGYKVLAILMMVVLLSIGGTTIYHKGSKSGALFLLNTKGTVTTGEGALMYNKQDSNYLTKDELRALYTLSSNYFIYIK